MKSRKQIGLGALLSYGTIAFNIIAGIVYTPWMISEIGQGNYGLYTLATSLISLFVMDFGMSAAVSRYVAKYNAENDQTGANNFLGIIYKLYVIIDIIILCVLVVAYCMLDKIYVNLTSDELSVFKNIFIIIGLFSIFSFPFTNLNGILTACEKFVQLKVCELFNKALIIISMIIALLLGKGLYALVLINATVGLITIILKLIIIKRQTNLKVNFRHKNHALLKDIGKFSLWTTIASIAQRFIFNIIPTILGIVSGSKEIAIFGIAHTIEGYVYTFSEAINGMFLPRITRIKHEKDEKRFMELMIKVGRLQSVIIGLIFIVFLTLGESFIVHVWVGSDYKVAYVCAIFLIVHYLIAMPQQIANTTLVVQNQVKYKAFILIGMAIVNLLLSFVLGKKWGSFGVSISVCCINILSLIAFNVVYRKVLGIDLKSFFKNVYSRQIVPYILTIIIGFAMDSLNPIQNMKLAFFTNAIIVCCSYFILEIVFVMKKEERLKITNKFRRKPNLE